MKKKGVKTDKNYWLGKIKRMTMALQTAPKLWYRVPPRGGGDVLKYACTQAKCSPK
jgi:hypothetical protein